MLRARLRRAGVDKIGQPSVKCAAAAEREVECQVVIRARRLDDCVEVILTAKVAGGSNGPEIIDEKQDQVEQICYIGPNGEPVPDKP